MDANQKNIVPKGARKKIGLEEITGIIVIIKIYKHYYIMCEFHTFQLY